MTTPLPLEPPDTRGAVATALFDHKAPVSPVAEAEIAIAADREALAEKGWAVTPVVKLSKKQLSHLYSLVLIPAGDNAVIEYLQSLGLPIELES